MRRSLSAPILLFATLSLLAPLSARAITFGSKDKVKVVNGAPFHQGNSFALGAFRVTFITEDEVVSVAKGSWVTGGSSSSASISGSLEGLDQTTMQRIADKIYADFVAQAAAHGLTLMDSTKLAQASASYKALALSTNFEQGRMGTVVIPTGQQSVALSEDGSQKANKGSKGLMAQWKQMGATDFATADANKAFPVAAKEVGMPVIGVTIVVNFADFQGGDGSFGHSKTGMLAGATIEGSGRQEMLRNTSIVGWAAGTATCAACMGQALLQGTVHSSEVIGSVVSGKSHKSTMGFGDGPSSSTAKKGVVVEVDPAAYEKNVLDVAAQTNALFVSALGSK